MTLVAVGDSQMLGMLWGETDALWADTEAHVLRIHGPDGWRTLRPLLGEDVLGERMGMAPDVLRAVPPRPEEYRHLGARR